MQRKAFFALDSIAHMKQTAAWTSVTAGISVVWSAGVHTARVHDEALRGAEDPDVPGGALDDTLRFHKDLGEWGEIWL